MEDGLVMDDPWFRKRSSGAGYDIANRKGFAACAAFIGLNMAGMWALRRLTVGLNWAGPARGV